MKGKIISQALAGVILLVVFIVFTVTLTFVNVKPIGPNGSSVAYADINKAVHEFFGENLKLYKAIDIISIIALIIPLGFAIIGLIEWKKRKSLFKVDSDILVLGVFYAVVIGCYLLFEILAVNYRPLLIEGAMEVSYPSSTTVLSICVMITAMMQAKQRIKNKTAMLVTVTACGILNIFFVMGRLISGVHWFTDIMGGVIISASLVMLYCAANNIINTKKAKKQENRRA